MNKHSNVSNLRFWDLSGRYSINPVKSINNIISKYLVSFNEPCHALSNAFQIQGRLYLFSGFATGNNRNIMHMNFCLLTYQKELQHCSHWIYPNIGFRFVVCDFMKKYGIELYYFRHANWVRCHLPDRLLFKKI